MTASPAEMRIVTARLATFEQTHQLSKRRASANGKKNGSNNVEWPHERPDVQALARAGFYYRPAHDSLDNVQCFLCTVKLDGWEPTDDPIQEHLAHSKGCAWATALSVLRHPEDNQAPESRDPFSEELLAARVATFKTGDGWPHEEKKGWKCKIAKLAEAGWAWDPSEDGEDGVTCFYCSLSLDGWEPKDDPFVEHKRRAPDCRFFDLLQLFHGSEAANGKVKRATTKGKASSRASAASKASRTSTYSTMSDVPSMPGSFRDSLPEASMASADDSVLTTATNTSKRTTAGTSKGKGRISKAKAAVKGGKARKQAHVDTGSEDEMEVQYPDLGQPQDTHEAQASVDEVTAAPPSRATRHGAQAQQQVDFSVNETSQLNAVPSKKTNRSRKHETSQQTEPRSFQRTPDASAVAEKRLSEVSAQLQDELEHSIDHFAPIDESTPIAEAARPKRGAKRMSDGRIKKQEIDSSVIIIEEPAAPKPQTKRAQGRSKKTIVASVDVEPRAVADQRTIDKDAHESGHQAIETVVKTAAPVAGRAKGRAKGKKASSTGSSRSSKTVAMAPEPESLFHEPEDLARDEMEIEQELERISAEQASQTAMATEQEQINEFQPSPSHGRISKDSSEVQRLSGSLHVEDEHQRSRQRTAISVPTPSPSGSDKENRPSSVVQPSEKRNIPSVALSPSKTLRIPLAAGTPNRSSVKVALSPNKQMSHLNSMAPWRAVDLDTVLLHSPQLSPAKVSEQLVAAAGSLTSPEKKMSVEEWVRFRAGQGEEELRKKCEEMVAAFEREGMRGLDCLNGVKVLG